MASATKPRSWNDLHRVYLNHLYALYHEGISWDRQLCDIGYQGYPDPYYEGSEVYTPDFLAFGLDSSDVQHIDVKGFEYIEDHFEGDKDDIKSKIASSISELTKYQSITDGMVESYLDDRGISFSPNTHEVVALLPYRIYDDYKETVERSIQENNLILWVIKSNSSSSIWKASGTHANSRLNDELSNRLSPYPATDLVQYTRQTKTAIKMYKFIEKLVKYCARERTRSFYFDEIDEVMISTRPPLLGHLPKKEREDVWGDYVYNLLHQLNFIKHGEGENEYVWKRKRFTTEPRDRKQILSNTKDKLGLES
jgi:hypothetical protein